MTLHDASAEMCLLFNVHFFRGLTGNAVKNKFRFLSNLKTNLHSVCLFFTVDMLT